MFVYALLNDQDICTGISRLTGSVESADLIPLLEYDEDYLWRKYDRFTGEWSEEKYEPVHPQPPEPSPADRIAQLEEENALLALELIDTQIRLEQAQQEQAALLLELVDKGVI